MPASTHRTSGQYLPTTNWHCPFVQPSCKVWSYGDPSSWMWNAYMLTSEQSCSQTQPPLNTSSAWLTPGGPLALMNSFAVTTTYMCWTWVIFAYKYCSTHMIIHHQDILVRQRCCTKSAITIHGWDS